MRIASWRLRAACRGQPLELFYGPPRDDDDTGRGPRETPSQKAKREARAKRFCDQCEVLDECLTAQLALGRGQQYGYAAGMNEDERVAYRRRMMRTAKRRAEAREGA
ncbi:WhiB family transcriptional regulator [Nonomuraea sp. NPDC050663]|uniref:WhiB family transcriptional regulator n=1 Tax=Nonomuraea sp. NPDC050663 TaxID=3364370 RepID=UPI0037B49040